MTLSRVSIQRPVLTTMMSLALILFGVIGLMRLPVRELPNIDPPIVTVTTVYPGANAAVVETEVTERLEEQLNSIEGIKVISSESREQVSNITIEFNLERDIELCAQDVRDRVARVRGQLPDDVEEPIVAKQEADASPVMWIALRSDRHTSEELSRLAENELKDRLQIVPGVSSIYIGGQRRFAMRLWLDSKKMAAHQITVLDIQRALRQQNIELPSGRVEGRDREFSIQTLGELKTAREFNDMVIRNDGATLVRLKDVGEAREGVEVENMRSVARANGLSAVALGVVKQSKANTIEVAKGIKAELERSKSILPPGIVTVLAYDESEFVEKSIVEVWETLGIAFVLVVMVIFAFLRSPRSTLIPSVAIPVSIVSTFVILMAFGYSINILTMLALVLAIGIVVDDAIVVLENIHRHIEEGLPPMKAAFKAMDEIGFAIIAITLSLVAVFIPLAFQSSTAGRLFVEFAVAVVGAVIISAFVSLTLTPMMSARILKPIEREKHGRVFYFFERGFTALTRGYDRTLGWVLNHRAIVVLGAMLTLGVTVYFFQSLERDFLPEEDKGRLLNVMVTPEGATMEYTDRMMRKAESIVSQVPEVQNYFSVIGLARAGPGEPNLGFMFMSFKDERARSVQDIVGGPAGMGGRFFNEVEGAFMIPIIPKAFTRSFSQPFQLVLESTDLEALARESATLANKLQAEGYLINVRPMFELTKPELRVTIDRDRAGALGVSVEEISRTLQILFGGLDLSKVNLQGKEYDVVVQLDRSARNTPGSLDELYVRNREGKLVQLSNVIRYEEGTAPNSIFHYNRSRSATIEATPLGVPLGTAIDRAEALLRAHLPAGFHYEWSGEGRELRETGQDIVFVLILAVIIVYMVLASQFESLVHPLTVMLALPLAVFGALGLLWLLSWVNLFGTGFYFGSLAADAPAWVKTLSRIVPRIPAMNINLFSQIGLVLLIGLVTKNSILLVEFANQRRAQGATAKEAMLQAGKVRLRPILMTSFTLILGIMPIAIGFGAGAESRRPMGVAIVGGMISSTFLTLVVIPVVYTLFSDLAVLFRKKPERLRTSGVPEPVAK